MFAHDIGDKVPRIGTNAWRTGWQPPPRDYPITRVKIAETGDGLAGHTPCQKVH